MSRIHILSDHLVSQIAAGEVVERPASVVKELLENALDAGARVLDIELVTGGKRLIRVRDDGSGMDRDDALLAFDRHATSKITTFEELESVTTLGFRGEALASIAAVSKVDMSTAAAAGEGFRVLIEGGRVRRAEPAAAPVGTSIEIRSLFFNVPARRKFLKTPRTELRRATEVVQAYALARPDVAVTLSHEGRSLLDVPATADGGEGLRQRIREIFGSGLSDALLPIGSETGRGQAIWGFVGDPGTTRGRRSFVFVNRRLIRDRAVMATFYRSVRDEWRSEDFPSLFLFLDLPGEAVDVNVHPQKAEVRFRDGSFLGGVYHALRGALAEARGVVSGDAPATTFMPSQPMAWQGSPGGDSAAGFIGEDTGRSGLAAPRMAEVTQRPMEPRVVPLSGRSGLPGSFRLLGQYKGTMLLLEGADGLYIIDQHVAHERILYERIRSNLDSDAPQRQNLLEPVVLELSSADRMALEDLVEGLEQCGFDLVTVGDEEVALAAVPAGMGADEAIGTLQGVLRGDRTELSGPDDLRRALLEEAAASMSCRAAVKMHDHLRPEEMEALLSDLFAAEQPFACPHGRPIVLRLSDADLETRFKRR